jgi:hypothetical protein
MRKIVDVKALKPFILRCTFDNGQVRDLYLEKHIDKNGKYSQNIFNELVFKTVSVGENGELFWKDISEIKELDGSISSCEYDISPDYAYLKSEPV